MKHISLFVFILLTITTYSQTAEVDSLQNLLKTYTSTDTIRVNILNDLASKIIGSDKEKAFSCMNEAKNLADQLNYKKGKAESLRAIGLFHIYYSSDSSKVLANLQEALAINEAIDYKTGIAKTFNVMGILYLYHDNYPKALDYFEKAVHLYQGINDDKNVSKCLSNVGLIYLYQNKYYKALKCYQDAILLSEKLNDKENLASCYSNIGGVYSSLGDDVLALENYQKALFYIEQSNNKMNMAKVNNNIATMFDKRGDYSKALEYYQKSLEIHKEINDINDVVLVSVNIGQIYLRLSNFSKAMEYLENAKQIAEKNNFRKLLTKTYNSIGEINRHQGNYNEALVYFCKALDISTEIEDKSAMVESYCNLADFYNDRNKFKEASGYANKAYQMAHEINNAELILKCAETIANTKASLGYYREAFQYYKEYKAMNDSLLDKAKIEKLTGLQYQYKFDKEKLAMQLEQEKKEAIQSEELRRQKVVRNSLIGGFLLLLILVLVILRSLLQKRKDNKILAEQKHEIETINSKLVELDRFKQTMTGMIVHDLKNPLNTILSRPSDERIKQQARQMLDMVINLLDIQKFENASMKIEPSANLLALAVNNAIEQIILPATDKNIEIQNTISHDITILADPDLIERVLTNLLTNAIKYTPNNGKVTLVAHDEGEEYVKIKIEDTGIGIQKDKQQLIFEKFGQVEAKQLGYTRSTGLGLTFCKLAIEAHGGKIGVESDGEHGTVFWFTLKKLGQTNNALPISKEEITQANTNKFNIPQEHLDAINQFKFYEVSKIRKALLLMPDNDNPEIQNWKEEVLKAVASGNEEVYLSLLNQVNDER